MAFHELEQSWFLILLVPMTRREEDIILGRQPIIQQEEKIRRTMEYRLVWSVKSVPDKAVEQPHQPQNQGACEVFFKINI